MEIQKNDEILLRFSVSSGAKVCQSCRSRKMPQNEYLLAKIVSDPADRKPIIAKTLNKIVLRRSLQRGSHLLAGRSIASAVVRPSDLRDLVPVAELLVVLAYRGSARR